MDKFESDKKTQVRNEKSKEAKEKKELEDKLGRMQAQFEKAAIESKKKMTSLEEENEKAKTTIQV